MPRRVRERKRRIAPARPRGGRKKHRPDASKPLPRIPRFVGKDGSAILASYPTRPWNPSGPVVADRHGSSEPGHTSTARSSDPASNPPSPAGPGHGATPATGSGSLAPTPSPRPLIGLERPFDLDEFSQLLGQNQIRVTVPRDSLVEVLRRVCEFMGFGIYVYSIRVRPAPEELLKSFVVELQRVDFSTASKDWDPFRDRGRADSPFGPSGPK